MAQSKTKRGGTNGTTTKRWELFPEYLVQTVDGRPFHVPQDLSGEYSVIIFYRGIW